LNHSNIVVRGYSTDLTKSVIKFHNDGDQHCINSISGSTVIYKDLTFSGLTTPNNHKLFTFKNCQHNNNLYVNFDNIRWYNILNGGNDYPNIEYTTDDSTSSVKLQLYLNNNIIDETNNSRGFLIKLSKQFEQFIFECLSLNSSLYTIGSTEEIEFRGCKRFNLYGQEPTSIPSVKFLTDDTSILDMPIINSSAQFHNANLDNLLIKLL
jgi:hypothetical protein